MLESGEFLLGKERLKHAAELLRKIIINSLWVEMCVLPHPWPSFVWK